MIAVLFARTDSIYKTIPGCEVYDLERDALTYPGDMPIVAHPPCRAWGSLSHLANPRPGERELAIWALGQVRQWGGVLEHPRTSRLWRACSMPMGKWLDEYGGFTLCVDQFWWGHRAHKRTLLYCCGLPRKLVPVMPIILGHAPCVVHSGTPTGHPPRKNKLPEIHRWEREATPCAFAEWLVELAGRCHGRY